MEPQIIEEQTSQEQLNQPSEDPGKTLGIVGLVLGLIGLSLVGLILSIVGNNKSKAAGFKNTIAIVGIWINSILLILGTLLVLMVFASVPALQRNADENRQRSEQLRLESE